MKSFVVKILIIFAIATLIRLVGLGKVPPHLSNDEISIAYDAYSMLHTGRDEHNQVWPLSFQSHNTYKAPLTAYLLVLPTALWGPGELASKLPSTVLGSLTVLVLMIVVWQVFRIKKLALGSGLILSMTPWHIFTSHMILESNIGLFFVVMGLALFVRYLEKKKRPSLILAMIFFALSIYSYHTEWIFTPTLMVGLVMIYRKSIRFKELMVSILVFGICVSPLMFDTLGRSSSSTRANTEAIIYEPTLQEVINNPKLSALTKSQTVANAMISNYVNYYNLGYLFAYGLDIPPKPLTTQLGLFLGVCLPLFIFGLMGISRLPQPGKAFLILFLLLAPAVPAMTRGGTNFVRALVLVIPLSIVIAQGLILIWEKIPDTKLRIGWVALPLLTGFGYFCLIYYFHYPIHSGENFEFGYKQVAQYIRVNLNKYDRIVVDPKFGMFYEFVGVPHLYVAYFTGYDPAKFLTTRRDLPNGLYFEPYEIREINWGGEKGVSKVLYVTPEANLPIKDRKDLKPIMTIDYPDGRPAYELFEGKTVL